MAKVNVGEELKKLLELQAVDVEIFAMKKELEAMPERIKEYDAVVKSKEVIFKTSEEKLQKLQLKRKDKEVELAAKEEAIKKHQNQQFQVKTNQEYTALQKEINSAAADKSVLEEDILKIFDEIDAAQKELAENKNVFQEEKVKIEAEKKEMEARKKELEEKLKSVVSDRDAIAAGVDKDTLARYEKILHARDGLALVPVAGDACGGCNMNLPPQVVNEVRLKQDFIVCGNCSRLLYYRD